MALIANGQMVFQRGYGMADREAATPATPSTNYYLASVTKQFTAMAIMMLEEAGDLAFDDAITKYFPKFPAYAQAITIRQLLHHTSGIADYFMLLPAAQTEPVRSQDVLVLLEHAGAPLSSHPAANTSTATPAMSSWAKSSRRSPA